MKTLAIIVDSFSGSHKKIVEKNNDFFFLPLKTILDGKEYLDGVDLDNKTLLERSYVAKDAKTSQPAPGTMADLFDKLSKEYEQVIYLPISNALSGTFNTAKMMSLDYQNVHVVPQIMTGDTCIVEGKVAQDKYNGKNIDEVIKYLETEGNRFKTYVIPKNNDAIIRGGRLGKAAAVILQKLKTVPIIGFEDNEKIHKKMIKRSGEKAVRWGIDKLMKDYESELKTNNYEWLICHNIDTENVLIAEKIINEYGFKDVKKQLTSSVIAIHTGDGAISISIRKKTV